MTRITPATIVRAWRDPKFARSLPEAIQRQLPPNPAGAAATASQLVQHAASPRSGEFTSACFTSACFTTSCFTSDCFTTSCFTTACFTSQCHSFECETSKHRCPGS